MIKTINNVRVNFSNNNSCHTTIDNLICSVCNKRTERVTVFYSKQNKNDIRFGCNNCFHKLFEEMLCIYDDKYLLACSVTDINFKTKKETKKKTRSEMTLKLRYEILKRDNFRCTVCGRRPPDVELCIDHIKPVAKGGTSTKDNLRTLCTDCNLGKGVG